MLHVEIIVCLSVLVFDQLTKHLIVSSLYVGQTIPIVRGIFHLTRVHNTGIAFGLFRNQAASLVAVSGLTIGFIVFHLVVRNKQGKLKRGEFFALFLILAGALGNLIDRLRFGYVIDFLDFRVWPVFNVADSAITIGVGLILLRCIRLSAK